MGFGLEYIVNREGIGYSVKGKLDDRNAETLKIVIRQHWREKLTEVEKSKGKQVSAEIDAHLSNINAVIDPIDYEAFCVPNIIQHSKHMQKEDFSAYLRLIEAMAVGYSEHLGKDLTNLILIGVTSKGRSVGSAEKYLGLLLTDINKRMNYYQNNINKRSKGINIMYGRLRAHNSSVLRFFRKRKITMLSKRIDYRTKELDVLQGRLQKYNGIITKINNTRTRRQRAAPQSPPKPSGQGSGL